MILTAKQQQVLDFIRTHFSKEGMAPSVREIAESLGKSPQAIQQHIEILRAKGLLQHQPSKSRANIPVQARAFPSLQVRAVPILGRIQAGLPVMAEENFEGSLLLPQEWAKDAQVFLLRVKGDSMQDAHIVAGDLALVRQQSHAENGEIVVARIHQADLTLKRFYRRSGRVILKADNSAYDPIEVEGDEIEVLGKLIGVFRKLP